MRRSAVRIRSQAPDQRVCDRNGRVHRISDRRWWTPGGSHYWRKGGPTLVAELSSRWSLARGGRPGRPNPIARLPLHPGDRSALLGEPFPFPRLTLGISVPKARLDPPNQPTARGTSRRGIATKVVSVAHGRRIPCRPTPNSGRRAAGGGSAPRDRDTGRGSRARRQ
jgi:hypothetical protein